MDFFCQDLKYGVRLLLKSPHFTVVTILTIALGVGANTAIFSVVNGVLLRPLPYDNPEQLVRVWGTSERAGTLRGNISEMDFLDFRAQNQVFEDIGAFNWTGGGATLSGPDGPERLRLVFVSSSFFPLLGVEPQLGRTFLPEEDQPGNERVTVLSHGLWARRFGSDPEVVGRTLVLNGIEYTVVGVTPQDFVHPEPAPGQEPELWIPLAIDVGLQNRGGRYLRSIARLKEGVSLRRAQEQMNDLTETLERQYPDSNRGRGVQLEALHQAIVGDVRTALLLLMAAVGLVLLIACANVANLFLSKTASRQREMAIRSAVGADRSRLVRQVLTESVLVSLLGGAVGVFLALGATDALMSLAAGSIPLNESSGLDIRVLTFTLALSVTAGLLFGSAPALAVSRARLSESLKEAATSVSAASRQNRARSLLVVLEIVLSVVLVVGAGLLIKSFSRLGRVDTGFRTEKLITMSLSLPPARYEEPARQAMFYRRFLERLHSVPGVESAAVINYPPLARGHSCDAFSLDDRPPFPPGAVPCAEYRRISPGYFRTLGVPLLQGRVFEEGDDKGAPPVAIIDETLARRFWREGDALGRRVTSHRVSREVVGIVGSVRHFGPEHEAPQSLYVPQMQDPVGWQTLVIWTATEPSSLLRSVRSEVGAMDPELPVFGIQTMDGLLYRSVAQPRFRTLLLGNFAAAALILAAVGVYGVVSYTVGQRSHEIGIRMALGAQRADIISMITGRGMLLALIGLAVGIPAAFVATRTISSLLFDVSRADTAIYFAVAAVLSLTALVACYVPAHRASKTDPLTALRYE